MPKKMSEIVNVAEEAGDVKKQLQEVADTNDAVLLAFIAPYGSVRVSPVEERSASILLSDEWGIEYALSSICSKISKAKKLFLLINSPGGVVSSCYNVAHMLRGCFNYIKGFVPQVALSGGTLVALASNELVMGAASRLSPIDVQVPYKKGRVSAYAMGRALSRLTQYFKTKTPEEAPYPWRAMAEKLDGIILEEWSTSLNEIAGYADEILIKSGYSEEKTKSIVKALVLTENTHSFVIHRERAIEIGLNLSQKKEDEQILGLMRTWLADYAFESKGAHCIRYIIPKGDEGDEGGKSDSRKGEGGSKKRRRKSVKTK